MDDDEEPRLRGKEIPSESDEEEPVKPLKKKEKKPKKKAPVKKTKILGSGATKGSIQCYDSGEESEETDEITFSAGKKIDCGIKTKKK